MAIKAVTATRMTMLQLKGQTKVATRGHKLLKDKRDGLMKEFMDLIRVVKEKRKAVEVALGEANFYFLRAQSVMPRGWIENTLAIPKKELTLSVTTKTVMSVKIPKFEAQIVDRDVRVGALNNRAELDIAVNKFSEVIYLLVELAELEKSAENLAVEIEKTRRRVNALEHKLIPDLTDTLRYVRMKLGEAERSGIVQVMAVKAMIEKEAAEVM